MTGSRQPKWERARHAHTAADAEPETASARGGTDGTLASISLIYESADGKLCLFEDADGHLTAVCAARLA